MTTIEEETTDISDGFNLAKFGLPKIEQHASYSYDLFQLFKTRLKFSLNRDSNHACGILGTSRSGKSATTKFICLRELERGVKIVYDNYKGSKNQPLPFRTYKIDVSKTKLDLRNLDLNDWKNLAQFKAAHYRALRIAYKEIPRDKLDAASLEKKMKKKKFSSNIRESVMNTIEDLENRNLLSNNGLDIVELLKKYDAIEIDSSMIPKYRRIFIPHICTAIMNAKMADVIPQDERILMAFDEISEPSCGVANFNLTSSVVDPVASIFSTGGSFNLYGIWNTQLPQKTHTSIIGNVQSKIIHQVNEPQAIGKISDMTDLSQKQLTDVYKIQNFRPGECLYITDKIFHCRVLRL